MAARLKVFTWSDGFHAFTVATRSRPKALDAFGSKQDLFATGLAHELSGGPDYDAALAAPGAVIERGLTIDIGQIKKAPKPRTAKGPTAAQRAKVEALAAQLEALDSEHADALAELDAAQTELRKRRDGLEHGHAKARSRLGAKLKAARARL